MLGLLIPDAVQRLLVEFASSAPYWAQGLLYALLCAGFVVLVARVLRRALLELDAGLAVAGRRQGHAPGLAARSAGVAAIAQWWIAAALCGVFVISAALHEASRAGLFAETSEPGVMSSANSIYRCLRPGSGRGADTLTGCYRR